MSTEEPEKATDSGADDEEEWLYGGEISFPTFKFNVKATHLFVCYLLRVMSSGWLYG